MKVNYRDKEFGSWEEIYFLWFCEDLKKHGFIKEIIHNTDQNLSQNIIEGKKKLSLIIPSEKAKTKNPLSKVEARSLLQPLTYTPDFRLEFNENAQFLLIDPYGVDTGALFSESYQGTPLECIIEIKPSVTFKNANISTHNSMRRFAVMQKVLFHMHNCYVNLIKSPEIFKESFVPTRYFYCNKQSSKRRKINFKSESLENFIKSRTQFLRAVSTNEIKKDETNIRSAIQKTLTG